MKEPMDSSRVLFRLAYSSKAMLWNVAKYFDDFNDYNSIDPSSFWHTKDESRTLLGYSPFHSLKRTHCFISNWKYFKMLLLKNNGLRDAVKTLYKLGGWIEITNGNLRDAMIKVDRDILTQGVFLENWSSDLYCCRDIYLRNKNGSKGFAYNTEFSSYLGTYPIDKQLISRVQRQIEDGTSKLKDYEKDFFRKESSSSCPSTISGFSGELELKKGCLYVGLEYISSKTNSGRVNTCRGMGALNINFLGVDNGCGGVIPLSNFFFKKIPSDGVERLLSGGNLDEIKEQDDKKENNAVGGEADSRQQDGGSTIRFRGSGYSIQSGQSKDIEGVIIKA